MTDHLLLRKAGILAQHFIGPDLDQNELHRLAEFAHLKQARANEVLFEKGEAGQSLMIVISGRVLIHSTSSAGKRLIINIIGPGEIFGEITVIDGRGRSAEAKAVAPTEYLVVERRDFMRYLEKCPAVSLRLLRLLCHRIRIATAQLEDEAFLDLDHRLARKLVAFMELTGTNDGNTGRITVPITQPELGAMLGVSRESVNKHLRRWARTGLIRIGRGRLTVLDSVAVKKLAGDKT
jgi:CRP/FNR family transcriptional regulator, cyclic AMP receptor protein